MGTAWVDALIWQGARADEQTLHGGLGLLLSGEIETYQHLAEQGAPWPALHSTETVTDPGPALLLAYAHQMRGEVVTAVERYRSLLREVAAPDLVAATAVLASIALGSLDQHDEGLAILREVSSRLQGSEPSSGHVPPAAPALLTLHRAAALAAQGDSDTAITELEELAGRDGRDDSERVCLTVGERNRRHLEWRRSWASSPGTPPQTEPLVRRQRKIAEGLDGRVDLDLLEVFDDLTTQEWHQGHDTVVDRALWAAVTADECLAHLAGLGYSRKVLGRHRLLRAARTAEDHTGPDAEDFSLLVQAGDTRGVQRAARWFRRRGPLVPVAAAVRRFASRPWRPGDELAELTLIRVAGDLLVGDEAEALVTRLYAIVLDDEPRELGYRRRYEAVRALPLLLTAAPTEVQSRAVSWLLDLMALEDELLLRALPAALRAVAWSDVDRAARSDAMNAVAAVLTEGGAWTDMAAPLLLSLREVEPVWAAEQALAAWRDAPSPLLGAVVLDVAEEIPLPVLSAIADQAKVVPVGDTRRLGGVNGALVLAACLARRVESARWEELLTWLAHPGHQSHDKIPVLDHLGALSDALPDEARSRLAQLLRDGITGAEGPLGVASPSALDVAALRLAARLGVADPATAVRRLVEFSTSPEATLRAEAARSLPTLDATDETLMLLRVLLRDRHHEVRASAARALCILRHPEQGWIRQAVIDQLGMQGVAQPLGALSGLMDADDLVEEARDAVADLADRSLAGQVRAWARQLLRPLQP
ncbi:MAG: hypothetical protein WD250_15875 [Egibacteraceae bacterium]